MVVSIYFSENLKQIDKVWYSMWSYYHVSFKEPHSADRLLTGFFGLWNLIENSLLEDNLTKYQRHGKGVFNIQI